MWMCYECAIQYKVGQIPLLRSYGRCEYCGNYKECFELIIHDKRVQGGTIADIAAIISGEFGSQEQEVNEMDRLRKIDPRGLEHTEDLVAFYGDLRSRQESYDELGIDIPAWLENKFGDVQAEIKARRRASVQARLEKLKAQRLALRTPDEKRKDVEAEIEALEKELSG